MPLKADEKVLLERAASWPEYASWMELTPETLQLLAIALGHDFAVALLYDRLRCSRKHGAFIREMEVPRTEGPWTRSPATLAIVPGAFYRERPETGADGRRLFTIAARLGCRAKLIPVAGFGSPSENARTLADWLTARPEEEFVLVSLSKGSLDVRTALTGPGGHRVFRNVIAWVSLSGMFQGTELVASLRRHRLRTLLVRGCCWWRGYPFATLADLARRSRSGCDEQAQMPKHLQIVHVLGFPLRRHLSSPLARRAFARLAPLGPNDGGGNLLGDATGWPGLIYPVWGSDHYLRPRWDIEGLLARLLLRLLTGERVDGKKELSVW
jgi:hypothetical protein